MKLSHSLKLGFVPGAVVGLVDISQIFCMRNSSNRLLFLEAFNHSPNRGILWKAGNPRWIKNFISIGAFFSCNTEIVENPAALHLSSMFAETRTLTFWDERRCEVYKQLWLICHIKLLRNPVYCFFYLCNQQINMQTMIVKH